MPNRSETVPNHIGPYEIRGELGRGAMAVVWRGYDAKLGREVAIKEPVIPHGITQDVADELGSRFIREGRAAAALSHPGIVTVFAADIYDGRPAIVMELIEGETLASLLRRGPLGIAAATGIADQLLGAVSYAHTRGVVHRDIKPDNVFVTDDGRVKLTDFGIAHVGTGTALTQAGTVMGTPGYMAPEQVRGEAVDARADIFAVGAMLHEMLTGENPFTAGDAHPTTIMYRVLNEPLPDVRTSLPDAPESLAATVAVATAKDAEQRFSSAEEMRGALRGDLAVRMPTRGARKRSSAQSVAVVATLATMVVLVALGIGMVAAGSTRGHSGPVEEATEAAGEEHDNARTPVVARDEVLIGVHTALTGGLVDYGFAAAESLKIAAEDYSGFEVDGVVYDIRLVIKDDKGEPAEAPNVARELVDEGVVAVIGALTSGSTHAALPVYQSAGIPVISASASAPDLSEQGYDNFFRMSLRDDLQGAVLGEWTIELGASKVVVMDDRGDYSVALGDEAQATIESKGARVLRQQGQEGDHDFSAQVRQIMGFGPDAVVFTGYHREAGLLLRQLRDAGFAGHFIGGDGIMSDEIAQIAGGAAIVEGAMCTLGWFAQEQMPGYPGFAAKFQAATGREAGPYAEHNYDALGAVVEAARAGGSIASEDISSSLRSISYSGVMGTLAFDEKGDVYTPGVTGTGLIPRYRFSGGTWELIR